MPFPEAAADGSLDPCQLPVKLASAQTNEDAEMMIDYVEAA